MRLEYEGLSRCEALSTEGARWFNNPTGFALYRYAYYVCFKCNKVLCRSFIVIRMKTLMRRKNLFSFKVSLKKNTVIQ